MPSAEFLFLRDESNERNLNATMCQSLRVFTLEQKEADQWAMFMPLGNSVLDQPDMRLPPNGQFSVPPIVCLAMEVIPKQNSAARALVVTTNLI
jgi:hypothetical protein